MPTSPSTDAAARSATPDSAPAAPTGDLEIAGVRITHPERVVDPGRDLRKIDLVRYGESVADLLLKHLKGRPVSLVRAPEGLDGETFFQKHAGRGAIPGLTLLDASLDAPHPPLIAVESMQAVIGALQMGAIEFHPWGAKANSLDRPDRLVLDLDPDPDLHWNHVIEAAELVRQLLDQLGLKGFLKTSGGHGLHIVLPLRRCHSWDGVARFARMAAETLSRRHPEVFVARAGAAQRVGRIFVDHGRNHRGATTVAAWSPRARLGLPVSVPLAWDELVALPGPAPWTISTVGDLLAERRDHDPWTLFETERQALGTAARLLVTR
jgi:bifunctional non-homologous end joining protein LigD